MEDRGYLTESGRVVQASRASMDPGLARAGHRLAANGEAIVADVLYAEQRYNLRRVLVNRTWYVRERHGERRQWTGNTRAEAVAAARAAGLVP